MEPDDVIYRCSLKGHADKVSGKIPAKIPSTAHF